jgi:hypothetical protein
MEKDQHFDTLQDFFGTEARRKFIALTYARAKEQYKDGMDSLKGTHRNAYIYILSIDPAFWATPFITGQRWGHTHQTLLRLLMLYFEKTDACPVLIF